MNLTVAGGWYAKSAAKLDTMYLGTRSVYTFLIEQWKPPDV